MALISELILNFNFQMVKFM